MESPRVENDTEFLVHPQLLCDRDGEKLAVMVKATFELSPDGKSRGRDGTFAIAPADRRRGIRQADIPWGKPEKSSILYPADLCLRKPGTDVIAVAVARAPGETAVPSFDAGLKIGKLERLVKVLGPRTWLPEGQGITEPRPIARLEVRWEYAFGGSDDSDPAHPVEDPRNPLGRGVARTLAALSGSPAPQLEDPAAPITRASDRPNPVGLSALGRHWEPRRALWGTFDKAWLEDRAPLMPADFDDRANHFAPSVLIASPALRGGEGGALLNLTPGGGRVPFVLPKIALELLIRDGAAPPVRFEPDIDTVVVDTLPTKVGVPVTLELTWRAFVPAPRRQKDVTIHVRESLPGMRR